MTKVPQTSLEIAGSSYLLMNKLPSCHFKSRLDPQSYTYLPGSRSQLVEYEFLPSRQAQNLEAALCMDKASAYCLITFL